MSKFSLGRGFVPAAAVFALALGLLVGIRPAHAAGAPASAAQVGEPTSVPLGWADFCRRYAGECDGGARPGMIDAGSRSREISLTAKARREIEWINRWVNANVEPLSDAQQWAVIDRWDYPSEGKGDCEDYALLKRRLLIEAGFPSQSLLMTVVKDSRNEGHALLTVKTNAGEFVLDNLNDEMKPWDQTGYRFVKRQSQDDQNVWVQLGDPTAGPDYVSR